MKILVSWSAVILVSMAATAQAIEISGSGGNIAYHNMKFFEAAKSGERARVVGTCLSACTLFLTHFPKERICVTAGARLGFHLAHDNLGRTRGTVGPVPAGIQALLDTKGQMTRRYLFVSAAELWKLGYKKC